MRLHFRAAANDDDCEFLWAHGSHVCFQAIHFMCGLVVAQHHHGIELHCRLLHHATVLHKGHSPVCPRDGKFERLNALLRCLGRSDLVPRTCNRSTDAVILCFLPELGLVQGGERRHSQASTDLRHCGVVAELERQGVLRQLLRKVDEVEFLLCVTGWGYI